MRDYIDLFRRVIKIVRTDYVGTCESDRANKTGLLTQRLAMGILEGFGADTRLYNTVGLYLASTRDPLVTFEVKQDVSGLSPYTRGFTVRSCGQKLFVDEAIVESRLEEGDEILELDGLDPLGLLSNYSPWVERDDPQARSWAPVICASNKARVRHIHGGEETIDLGRFPLTAPSSRVGVVEVGNGGGAVIVRLEQLNDATAVQAFVANHSEELDSATRLTFDLRHCMGLSEGAVRALMPYLLAKPTALADYLESRYIRRFSVDNCHCILSELKNLRSMVEADGEAPAWLKQVEDETRSHEGRGDVELELEADLEFEEPVPPRGTATDVGVIIDKDCKGTGEVLALVAKDSPRAHVIGRATSGSLGHFGSIRQEIAPGLAVSYPTCRYTDEALQRLGTGHGIEPEDTLDWTPGVDWLTEL